MRISPNAVHVNDPDFFDTLYRVNKLEKDPKYYRMLGLPHSSFQTQNADLHRIRRKAMSRFFTPARLPEIEAVVNRNLTKLLERLDDCKASAEPVNLSDAFRCLTTDAITEYVLPRGARLLDRPDFAAAYNHQLRDLGIVSILNRTFPFLLPLFMSTPRWLVRFFAPVGALEAVDVQADIIDQAKIIATSSERNDRTVIHGILNSELPSEEKRPSRVVQDAYALVLAGSETTAMTLEKTIFYVLSSRSVVEDLTKVLRKFIADGNDPSSSTALRKLPLLSAVIKEGQRLAIAVSGRLPRLDPANSHVCNGVALPAGTSISMSISAVHLNPTIYPDPTAFDPSRFLHKEDNDRSEAYLVPFGRGSRMCLGMEFANVSTYLTLAQLLLRYDMTLSQTTIRDVDMAHNMFSPFPAKDSRGVRVILR